MNYFQRLQKAIFLDVAFYEEVEKDKKFTDQAMMTVVLVSVVQGFMIAGFAPIALVQGILGSLIRFLIWAFFIAFVGTRILPEPETESNTGELIRTLGFAYAPGLLVVFKIFPIYVLSSHILHNFVGQLILHLLVLPYPLGMLLCVYFHKLF